MITVLCANPALDVTYRVHRVTRGAVHSVGSVWRRAGGKGANVARVLGQLGAPVTLVAPLGGLGGAQYAAEFGPGLVPVPIAAPPRTSVCVVDEDATIFNEPGALVSSAEWEAVVSAVVATEPDVLVLSGSLPQGVPADAYAGLVAEAQARTVVDTKGLPLRAVLAARPDLVAPNLAEVREIVGDVGPAEAAAALCERGARAAAVSAGPDGVVAVTSAGRWRARPPRVLTGNPTGAGDALTAALALGLAREASWPEVLRDAVATSAAALACDTAGEIDLEVRAEVAAKVVVEEVPDAAGPHG